jgi:transposase-like protein
MTSPCYSGYGFPSEIIERAIWLYLRFTLYRNVEELLSERRDELSYETKLLNVNFAEGLVEETQWALCFSHV